MSRVLSVEILEGARLVLRRSLGANDRFLAGPAPDAELATRALTRTIPLIRSTPEAAGWEILAPAGLEGSITTDSGTRSIAALAATARREEDLAVVPLPAGARGSLELGEFVVRFREVDEAAAPQPLARAPSDATFGAAIGIGLVALAFVLIALISGPATHAPTIAGAPTPTDGHHATAATTAASLAHANTPPGSVAHADATPVSVAHADATPVSVPHADATPVSAAHAAKTPVSVPHADATPVSVAHADATPVSVAHADATPAPRASATPHAKPGSDPGKTRDSDPDPDLASADPDADWNATPAPEATARATPVTVARENATHEDAADDDATAGKNAGERMGDWSDEPANDHAVTPKRDPLLDADPDAIARRNAAATHAAATPRDAAQPTPAPRTFPTPVAAATPRPHASPAATPVRTRVAHGDAGGGSPSTPLAAHENDGPGADKTTLAFLDATRTSEKVSKPGFEEKLARATSAVDHARDAVDSDAAHPARAPETFDGGLVGSDAGATRAAKTREGGTPTLASLDVGPASRDVRVASAGKVETAVEARGRLEDPAAGENADSRAILEVVQGAQGGLRRCYEDQLRRNPQLGGRVVLSWTVADDGAAEDVAVEQTTLKDADVEACMKTRVRRLRFPAPHGGAVRVEFPFLLQAAVDQG